MQIKFAKSISLLLSLLLSVNAYAVRLPNHYKEVKAELKPFKRTKAEGKESHGSSKLLSSSPIKRASSGNWSGYAIQALPATAPNSAGVTQVLGSWYVPAVTATPGYSVTYSSFWVGIDGLTDGQVEQLGTEQDVINGVQQNYAWFEMYPQGAYVINGFPVNVGDLITAEVNYGGNNVFYLTIVNDTQGVFFLVPRQYTTVSTFAPRSSAEWIAEAPYYNGILPLANFGTANFYNCTAQLNWGATKSIAQYANNEPINMVDANGQFKDITSGLSAGYGTSSDFSVTWQRSN